ncbi:MAG: epoxide hydrolase [Acidimicrobiales bacterium]
MSDQITPFRIAVDDDVLEDLRARLRNTRWPEAELVDDWSQGVPLAWVQDMCRYWAEDYDWRAREAALNRFDQFTTTIDGHDLHFIHQRSPHPEAKPLLITHGWPGSIVEFHKVIEPLVDPTRFGGDAADAFHVVAPSLPGYGFSAKPKAAGTNVDRIAELFMALMARLGYDRYFAQGGDWGSAVTTSIGGQDPEHCLGIHITLAMIGAPKLEGEPSAEEQRAIDGSRSTPNGTPATPSSSPPGPRPSGTA